MADYDFYDPFTLSAWIRADSGTGGIVARYKADGPKGYGLFLVDSKLQLRLDTSSISDRTRIESEEAIPLGEWTHVLGTYDGTRNTDGMRLYVNGRRVAAKSLVDESLNSTKTDEPLRIGYGPGPGDRFQGLIDDVRVYSRALSAGQAEVVAVAETASEIAGFAPGSPYAGPAAQVAMGVPGTRRACGLVPVVGPAAQACCSRGRISLATLPTVMVMAERAEVRPTHILFRGAFDAPARSR